MWGVLHITGNEGADAQIGPGDSHKFQTVVLIGIGIGLVASLVFHVFLKEGANGNGDVNGNRTQRFRYFCNSYVQTNGRQNPTAISSFRRSP